VHNVWPPLFATSMPRQLARATRPALASCPASSEQVVYNHWPLYTFAAQRARPKNGQGGLWFRRKVVRGHAETAALTDRQIQRFINETSALDTCFAVRPRGLRQRGYWLRRWPSPSSQSGPATISVQGSGLGQILVDGNGKTLYLFEADTSTQSTCSGACAQAWPPLTTNGSPKSGRRRIGVLSARHAERRQHAGHV